METEPLLLCRGVSGTPRKAAGDLACKKGRGVGHSKQAREWAVTQCSAENMNVSRCPVRRASGLST